MLLELFAENEKGGIPVFASQDRKYFRGLVLSSEGSAFGLQFRVIPFCLLSERVVADRNINWDNMLEP